MNVRGGQLIQSNGNPVFPGTKFSGPLLAGSILRTGGLNKAGLGSTSQDCLANVGYAHMAQVGRITEVAAPGYASPDLVIPAQSLITKITLLDLVTFGAAVNVGDGVTAAKFGALGPASGGVGIETLAGAALLAWLNTGSQDTQLVFTGAAAGAGVGIVIVNYIQGINAAIA